MAGPNRRVLWPLWLALVAAAFCPALTQAQPDDWQVRRDPFDKSVVARYKGILNRQPHDAGALAKLLELYRRYRTVDLLISEYQATLTKKPNDWAALVVLARIHRTTGDEAAALALMQRAMEANPNDATGWLSLGDLHKGFGKAADARGAFERALTTGRDKPTRSRALRALAALALASGDTDAANRYFKQFLELDPKNA
ncbi:MAG TPA: tetratricopeptide repeat protein, partial [Kofleriaceae bacterium]|nr:tetratricopeptide repeat protein [Kofleriaceae bacterium]